MMTLLKTATYALTHFVVAVGVAFALTQDWRIALGIGLIEPAVQTIAYVIHEKVWERLPGAAFVRRMRSNRRPTAMA